MHILAYTCIYMLIFLMWLISEIYVATKAFKALFNLC